MFKSTKCLLCLFPEAASCKRKRSSRWSTNSNIVSADFRRLKNKTITKQISSNDDLIPPTTWPVSTVSESLKVIIMIDKHSDNQGDDHGARDNEHWGDYDVSYVEVVWTLPYYSFYSRPLLHWSWSNSGSSSSQGPVLIFEQIRISSWNIQCGSAEALIFHVVQ